MKKLTLAVVFVLVAMSIACFGLSVESYTFAKYNKSGKLQPVKGEPVYSKTDKVVMVLLNVDKFKKGSDGSYILDIDLSVKGPDGKVMLEKKGLLPESEGREAVEKNGFAESPYGIFTPAKDSKSGKYQMTVTARDKVAGTSASKTESFRIK